MTKIGVHEPAIDEKGFPLPAKVGSYKYKIHESEDWLGVIDVYFHPVKGLSCFSEDFGSSGTGVADETDCHVSVHRTGLIFGPRIGPCGTICK
jgi:hypothetical protein